MILFPIFLKLSGRRCLVVGAGAEGESKMAGLLLAGAEVHVVAPRARPQVRAWSRKGKIEWKRRRFRVGDLEGMFLVVAATSSPKLHQRIHREARRRGVLCNSVDDPPRCDFYCPAVVRRGALQIAISTSGHSPALAQRLRKELERQFGPEYEAWVEHLGKTRKKVLAEIGNLKDRRHRLHEQAGEKAFETFARRRSGGHRRTGS
jgi:precorrin-2 dehydrogenase / sirohydrochlorin ferrochelatase